MVASQPFLVFAFGVHRAFCPSTLVDPFWVANVGGVRAHIRGWSGLKWGSVRACRSRALYNTTHVHSSFPSRVSLCEAEALTDIEDIGPTRWSGGKITYKFYPTLRYIFN